MDFYSLYFSPDSYRVTCSEVWHGAGCIEMKILFTNVRSENIKGRDHLSNLSVGGKMALKEVGCVMDSSAWGAGPASYPVVTSSFSPPG
jgi:hypothetical protein